MVIFFIFSKLNDFAQEWASSIAETDFTQHREENPYGENIYVEYNSDPEWKLEPDVPIKSWLVVIIRQDT